MKVLSKIQWFQKLFFLDPSQNNNVLHSLVLVNFMFLPRSTHIDSHEPQEDIHINKILGILKCDITQNLLHLCYDDNIYVMMIFSNLCL